MSTRDEYLRWESLLDAITNHAVALTPWEEGFIDSMNEKFGQYGANIILSEKQVGHLERIHEQRIP